MPLCDRLVAGASADLVDEFVVPIDNVHDDQSRPNSSKAFHSYIVMQHIRSPFQFGGGYGASSFGNRP